MMYLYISVLLNAIDLSCKTTELNSASISAKYQELGFCLEKIVMPLLVINSLMVLRDTKLHCFKFPLEGSTGSSSLTCPANTFHFTVWTPVLIELEDVFREMVALIMIQSGQNPQHPLSIKIETITILKWQFFLVWVCSQYPGTASVQTLL